MQNITEFVELLVCPETKLKLRLCTSVEAEKQMHGRLSPLRKTFQDMRVSSPPFGVTPYVLLREDLRCAYPVVDSVPILLVPEMLATEDQQRSFDLRDPKYAEAYEEMAHYNEVATKEAQGILDSESFRVVEPVLEASRNEIASFPSPKRVWLDATYDCAAQWDTYQHIGPLPGKRVIQLGGKGAHAVKFLLGGADEAWTITPMLGEARSAFALAQAVGVADRLRCVVAVAEELPLVSSSFDALYSGGCIHHMAMALAIPEAARVLKPGGRFAAADPWKTPLHTIGTKILGKREASVYCRPLTEERVEPIRRAFGTSAVIQHGTLMRYPLLALNKFGISSKLSTAWHLNRIDDALCSLIPGCRRMGGSVALLGTK